MGGLLSERLLIYDIGHLRDVAAVVGFEDVDQSLDAAASHAFVRIGREAGDAGSAGEMRHESAAIGNRGIAQRRIGGEGFFFVDIESGTGDPVFAQSFHPDAAAARAR